MKLAMKVTPLPLVVLALLSACTCDQASTVDAGAVDAGPPVLAEREPNDGPDKAMVLDRSAVVEANLGADPAKPDHDWYVFKAAMPKTVDLRVSCPPGADVAIELVDETGTVLQAINAAGVGTGEHLPNLDVSGKAFARVVSLRKGAGGAYTLTARFADRAPGYEIEPNDRRVDATQVALGQAISGYLAHGNDVDLYRFELPLRDEVDAGQALETADDAGLDAGADGGVGAEPRLSLRIDLSAIEGVALEAQVMTEAEAVLFSARSRENGPLSLRNVGVRAADRLIYVAVRSAPLGTGKDVKRGFNAGSAYTLTAAPEEAGASSELEPNDDPAHATDLPPNSYRDGYLSPRGDADYFRLVTDGPALAKVHLAGVEKVDLVLSVVRALDGKPDEVVLKANEGGTREPEQLNNVSCPGSCLLKVEAATRKVDGKWVKEDENADSSYRLSTIVVPDDGSEEREPNSSAASATPAPFGKPLRGTVYPTRDVDFFQVDLRERQVKTPVRASLTGVLKVDVGLYLHRVETDGKLTLVQTSDGAKGDKPETIRYSAEPGLYVLEVRDVKNREANFQDSYQLSVDEDAE